MCRLGRALCGDGKTEKDVGLGLGTLRRRAQAGANTTGEEQTTVGRTRMTDGGWRMTDYRRERHSHVRSAG